jgi:hypothetical protein
MSNHAGEAIVMRFPFPRATNAATQVRRKRTDNLTEQATATGRMSQQSDGLVSGA